MESDGDTWCIVPSPAPQTECLDKYPARIVFRTRTDYDVSAYHRFRMKLKQTQDFDRLAIEFLDLRPTYLDVFVKHVMLPQLNEVSDVPYTYRGYVKNNDHDYYLFARYDLSSI